MIDISQPMMIQGEPDLSVSMVSYRENKPNEYEGFVYPNGTWISFRENGWVTSTTYATSKVINRSAHDAAVAAAEEQARLNAEMTGGDLWGSF